MYDQVFFTINTTKKCIFPHSPQARKLQKTKLKRMHSVNMQNSWENVRFFPTSGNLALKRLKQIIRT